MKKTVTTPPDFRGLLEKHANLLISRAKKDAYEKLRADLLMLRQSNNEPGWKEAIDAVSNILP